MQLSSAFLFKFVKFCTVGFSGMMIDFGFTWLFKEKVKLNKYIANSCGFILAASSNYLLNRLWTFHSHNEAITREYTSFLIISVIGLALNNLFIYIFTEKLKFNFYISKIFAIGLVTIWNFGMNYIFTFTT